MESFLSLIKLENHSIVISCIPMFLSLSNSMSCLMVSNAEDKSSSISCISCPVSSELYKLSKRESTVVSVLWYVYVCV